MKDDADTVIVAARYAWPEYLHAHGYVCQPGRTFRGWDSGDVKYMAFY